MNKIIFSIMAAAAALMPAACSDDEGSVSESVPVVESSDLTFDATASQGSISLLVDGVEAESAADWCSVSVSGRTATVSVPANAGISARSTAVILTYAGDQTIVPVTQKGLTFTLGATELTFASVGGTDTVGVYSQMPLEVTASAEWLTASLTDDGTGIVIAAQPYTGSDGESGRSATVSVRVPAVDMTKTVAVHQTRPVVYEDYLGTWTLQGIDINGSATQYELTVSENVAGQDYLVSGWSGSSVGSVYPFVMNYQADDAGGDGIVYITGSQYLGDYSDYGVYFCGVVRYGTGTSLITGTYVCMAGVLVGDRVDWKLNTVELSAGELDFIGMRYYLRTDTGWSGFTADANYPVDNITMVKTADANKSATAAAAPDDRLVPAVAMKSLR